MNREAMFEQFKGWAETIARQLHSKTPFTGAEYEDYQQYASVGLLEAIDSYDREKCKYFKHYSKLRIKGAILNSVFKFTEISDARQQSKIRNKEYIIQYIDDEAIKHQAALESLSGIVEELVFDYFLTEVKSKQIEKEYSTVGMRYSSPEFQQIQDKINQLTLELDPPIQKTVLHLYYISEKSYAEIADILAVSKSQVYKLHKKALVSLKKGCISEGVC